MLPRTIDSYGGTFVDAIPVDDPTTTESASFHNRVTEDTAQMTRTGLKAWVQFLTATSGSSINASAGLSIFGTGSLQLPTITRTGTGLYTITYPTSWVDGLQQTETIVFADASGSVVSTTTVGRVQVVPAGSVLSVLVISNIAGTDTPSDLTGGTVIRVEAR